MQHATQLHIFIEHYITKNEYEPCPIWELIRLAQELDSQVELRTFDSYMMEFLFTDGSNTAFDYRDK